MPAENRISRRPKRRRRATTGPAIRAPAGRRSGAGCGAAAPDAARDGREPRRRDRDLDRSGRATRLHKDASSLSLHFDAILGRNEKAGAENPSPKAWEGEVSGNRTAGVSPACRPEAGGPPWVPHPPPLPPPWSIWGGGGGERQQTPWPPRAARLQKSQIPPR